MGTPKLKYSEVQEHREKFRSHNSNKCPLCGEYIKPHDAALDHDHKSGHIRDTIHKDCNILLGKIENYINRYGKRFKDPSTLREFLSNTASYMLKDYTDNPFHPTHKTPEDKELRELKRRLKRAKRHETKEKYKRLIKEFNSAS